MNRFSTCAPETNHQFDFHSLSLTRAGQKLTAKGCATKEICSKDISPQIKAAINGDIRCCQGDYCNSAISTSASLLLLVAPLISLVLFS